MSGTLRLTALQYLCSHFSHSTMPLPLLCFVSCLKFFFVRISLVASHITLLSFRSPNCTHKHTFGVFHLFLFHFGTFFISISPLFVFYSGLHLIQFGWNLFERRWRETKCMAICNEACIDPLTYGSTNDYPIANKFDSCIEFESTFFAVVCEEFVLTCGQGFSISVIFNIFKPIC